MMNSISTIFTMDIFQQYINKNASSRQTVNMGRISAAVALIIAMVIAPLLANGRGIFNVIQEYTAVVSPGILAVFIMGLFYKKANSRGAIIGVLVSIILALGLKFSGLNLPWMHETGIVFVTTLLLIAGISHLTGQGKDDPNAIQLSSSTFKTSGTFNIMAFTILLILAFIYALFW